MSASRDRKQQSELTRGQILAAAAERFARCGFGETRLEDVGRDVGISRSAVLYHYKDKQGLYRAVLDEIFGGLLAVLRTSLVATGSLADRLEKAVSAFVDYMGSHPLAALIAIRESVVNDPQVREEIQHQARPFLVLLEMIFEEGERSGAFKPLRSDALHFVSTIAGSTLFYVASLPTFVGDPPYELLSEEQIRAHKRDMLEVTRRLLGIRGPSPVSNEAE